MPEYEAAASHLQFHNPPIAFAKIDAIKYSELATEFEVKGFPTMILFKYFFFISLGIQSE